MKNNFSLNNFGAIYISTGCNKSPKCLDWGNNDLICYGSDNSVVIYNPNAEGGGKIICTLTGHTERINCVQWIRNKTDKSPEIELISVSADATCVVWSLNKDKDKFCLIDKLKDHAESIKIAESLQIADGSAIIVTGSIDFTVKYWTRKSKNDKFVCKKTMNLVNRIAISLSLEVLPETVSPLLALTMDDCQVHLYLEDMKIKSLAKQEDWIRGLHFSNQDLNGDILLASAAEDTIRLWRFTRNTREKKENDFQQKEETITIDNVKYYIYLESVMLGHESLIYGLQWCPTVLNGEMMLMSASLDRIINLWQRDADSGVWLEKVKLGAMGGNSLGYYGAKFSPDGLSLLGHSFQGAFHRWNKINNTWSPGIVVSGHAEEVEDIVWERGKGRYLLSASFDETVRLHAPWRNSSNNLKNCWFEMSRPQIHGYPINCLAPLKNYSFASGSEEKIVRVFNAPKNVLENINTLTKLDEDFSVSQNEDDERKPQGAAVPSLGLSNRAVFEGDSLNNPDNTRNDKYSDIYFTPQILTEPPNEDNLTQNTLWPEIMKLYGHGFEVYSMASSYCGTKLATACKATIAEHAKIIIWDTKSWKINQELHGHQLTVTQMAFSPNNKFLLSVSRDRKWCLFERTDITDTYKLIDCPPNKVHTRIIWSCAWSFDSKYFITGSRDGKVAIWNGQENIGKLMSEIRIRDPVTAVAISPILIENNKYIIAIGCECGSILVYLWSIEEGWKLTPAISEEVFHNKSVRKLEFKPLADEDRDNDVVYLASCSSDRILKILLIKLCDLITKK